MKKKIVACLLVLGLFGTLLVACGGNGDTGGATNGGAAGDGEIIELSFMVDPDANTAGLMAIARLAEQEIGIRLIPEIRPGGLEGENLLRTRFASGDAADIHWFNSGALLQTLNPAENFIDLSGQPFLENVEASFLNGVSVGDEIFGLPARSGMVGGIFYNKEMYREHGLEVPNTWDEFMANVRVLHEAGEVAILGSYADAWTSQVPMLGDNFNVLVAEPDFAEEFEAGRAKFADTPAALRSFEKTAEIAPYLNMDFMAVTFEEAVSRMANGEGGHWFILSFFLDTLYSLYGEEAVNNIGVFGVPGDTGERGLTTWLPETIYGNRNSDNVDAILEFFEFFMRPESQRLLYEAQIPDGPIFVYGVDLPADIFPAVSQMMEYIETGRSAPALEFMTTVKGPNLPSITQAVVAGQMTPHEAAIQYDEDAAEQARQLGFDW